MGEDDFDWGSLFGGGDTDMSGFDMGGFNLDELALSDLGNFDIGDLDLGNMDFGNLDLSNLDFSGIDLGNMDFGDIGDQGIDINSILEGLQTDRVGGQNLDLESLLQEIGGGDIGQINPELLQSIASFSPETSMSSDDAIQTALADNVVKTDFGNPFTEEETARLTGQNAGAYLPSKDEATNVYDQEDMEAGAANSDISALEALMGGDLSSLGMGDLAKNAAGAYDQDYSNISALEALMGSNLSSPDEADISNLGMGDLAENVGGAYDQNYDTQNAEIQKLLGLHPAPAEEAVTPEPADTEQERELKSLINKYGSAPTPEPERELTSLQNRYGTAQPAAAEEDTMARELTSLQNKYGTAPVPAKKSGNEAVASGMSPGSIGAKQAVSASQLGDAGDLTSNQLAQAYGTSGIGSIYRPDSLLSSGESKNKAIVSGNAPGTIGAKALVDGELNSDQVAALLGKAPAVKSINEIIASGNTPESAGAKALVEGNLTPAQVQALTGQSSGLTSLLTPTGVSKNKAIASGTSPSSEGAQALADAVTNSSSDNAFTPAETAALVGKTPTNTSTGISKNEAIASGMSPGSAGAKAAAAGELSPEELAATQGVVTKGSFDNPITSAEKTADALKKIADAKKAATPAAKDSSNNMGMMMMLMALMAMMNKGGGSSSSGATVPSLSADRKQLPYGGGSSSYRPGQGGVSYFTPTTYTTKAAGGGLMSLNGGGHLGGYSDGGRLLRGPGDGVSDSIPATIGGKQPARLATGEFVVPARIVSELGNGSTDSGAQRLYEMMDRVQHARRKTKNVAADTKAAKYLPA